MQTGRISGAHRDVTAVTVLPDVDLAFLKDLLGRHIFQQSAVALLVVLLNFAHCTEFRSRFREALGLGGFQEQGVNLTEALPLGLGGEVGILVPGLGLTGESGFQVFLRQTGFEPMAFRAGVF